jgi:hypothetical protein
MSLDGLADMDLVHEIIPAGRLGPLLDESLTG